MLTQIFLNDCIHATVICDRIDATAVRNRIGATVIRDYVDATVRDCIDTSFVIGYFNKWFIKHLVVNAVWTF